MKKNPFPLPTPLELRQLRKLALLASEATKKGWCPATAGNFSLRGKNGLFWQSPSGIDKSQLKATRFVPVGIEDCHLVNPISKKPSDETPIHAGIYRLKPEVICISHVHSPHLIRFMQNREKLIFSNQEILKAFGGKTHAITLEPPMIENTQDMPDVASRLPDLISDQIPILIIRDHGVYAWGSSVEKTFFYLEALEFLCQSSQ